MKWRGMTLTLLLVAVVNLILPPYRQRRSLLLRHSYHFLEAPKAQWCSATPNIPLNTIMECALLVMITRLSQDRHTGIAGTVTLLARTARTFVHRTT